jgi:hypothetical protein
MDIESGKNQNQMNQTDNDIKKKNLKRRTFFKQALLISAGGIIGLNFLKDKFKLRLPKVSSTRVKYKKKLVVISKDAGFYINQKKNKAVIYYLSMFGPGKEKTYSPALKTIPSNKLDMFVAHLKKIEIEEVNKLLQNPENLLLNPVWTAERLSKDIQKAQFVEYLNFIDTLFNQRIIVEFHSRIKLLYLYLNIYKLEVRKNKYALKSKLSRSEKKFLQAEKEKERKKVLAKYIYSK